MCTTLNIAKSSQLRVVTCNHKMELHILMLNNVMVENGGAIVNFKSFIVDNA